VELGEGAKAIHAPEEKASKEKRTGGKPAREESSYREGSPISSPGGKRSKSFFVGSLSGFKEQNWTKKRGGFPICRLCDQKTSKLSTLPFCQVGIGS